MNKKGRSSVPSGRQPLDEVEQLRTSLESALKENCRLTEDRDRLLRRVAKLSRDLQAAQSGRFQPYSRSSQVNPSVTEEQSQVEEELRIAFEGLRVLTEELEIANISLHQVNQGLDARAEEHTRQMREINAALRATESSLQMIADVVPDLLWRSDAVGLADWFNHRWLEYTGLEADELMGQRWADALHPLDRDAALTDWTQAIAEAVPCQQERRVRDAQGNYRWFLIRAEPMRDKGGAVVAWYAAATDTHEQRIALDSLRQSELRFRTLTEGMPQLVWRAVDGGHWTWSSPQWTAFTGQSQEASHAQGWLDMLHPDDRAEALAAWEGAQLSGHLKIEGRIFHAANQSYRHFRTRALPVRNTESQMVEWLGTSTDVDDILQLQARQEVLVGELHHRTRNLMGMVQSITGRTLKDSSSLDSFAERIQGRFGALARVQTLLSRRKAGQRVAFDHLLREVLSAHVHLDGEDKSEQVILAGPPGVPLRSATVQTLALALHELTTNAAKYGALAQPGARLEICWEVREPQPNEWRLFVDWRERGLSEMLQAGAAPKGDGFGRELIERALPYQLNAATSYALKQDGIHCTINVRVPMG